MSPEGETRLAQGVSPGKTEKMDSSPFRDGTKRCGDEEKIPSSLRGRRQQPERLLAGRAWGRFDSSDAGPDAAGNAGGRRIPFGSSGGRRRSNSRAYNNERSSEEHTSELQSRPY